MTRRREGEPPTIHGWQRSGEERDHVNDDRRKLAAEVRQSLSLIGMTILTISVSIAFGIMVGQLG